MTVDYGSSSSSELDDEASGRGVDERDAVLSFVVGKVSGDNGDDPGNGTTEEEPPGPVAMAARAYQLEMLEESLKQNIIVAVCYSLGPPMNSPR